MLNFRTAGSHKWRKWFLWWVVSGGGEVAMVARVAGNGRSHDMKFSRLRCKWNFPSALREPWLELALVVEAFGNTMPPEQRPLGCGYTCGVGLNVFSSESLSCGTTAFGLWLVAPIWLPRSCRGFARGSWFADAPTLCEI